MRFSRTVIWLCLFFIGLPGMLHAQDVRVKASVNRDRILIGEQVILQMEAELPEGARYSWFPVDSLDHFEWITKGNIDTLDGIDGKLYKQQLTLTSFDSGSWVIPRLALLVDNNRYVTDSITIHVNYSDADPAQPYHDVKPIIEVPAVDTLYINYLVALGTLLAIAGLIYLLYKKKKPAAEPVHKGPVVSPFEKAMKAIAILKPQLQGGTPAKGLYIAMNDVLRDYFREEKLVMQPDSTNDQLVMGVRSHMQREHLTRLAQSLRLVDAVKFAKYSPTGEENEQVWKTVEDSIEAIDRQIHKKENT